jgi:hypothetical protein
MPLCPAGVAHGAWNNELELLAAVRELVTYLPLSNRCVVEGPRAISLQMRLHIGAVTSAGCWLALALPEVPVRFSGKARGLAK